MANLFWTHPNGDQMPNVPCIHWSQVHPGGDRITVPGGTITVPCSHLSQVHSGGDPGPMGPCLHPMQPVEFVPGYGVVFYTSDTTIRKATFDGIDALRTMGVTWGPFQRPLSIFSRQQVDPNARPSEDAFKTQYLASAHAIQILPEQPQKRHALLHELGHALIGQGCPRITGSGGQHNLFEESSPGTALSDGWAHFVGLAIENSRSDVSPDFLGISDWLPRRQSVPKSARIEYNVTCTLWDLFDTTMPFSGHHSPPGSERARFTFKELFGVFSPTLQTLLNGPGIPNVDDYLTRLRNNHPGRGSQIDQVRALHLA